MDPLTGLVKMRILINEFGAEPEIRHIKFLEEADAGHTECQGLELLDREQLFYKSNRSTRVQAPDSGPAALPGKPKKPNPGAAQRSWWSRPRWPRPRWSRPRWPRPRGALAGPELAFLLT